MVVCCPASYESKQARHGCQLSHSPKSAEMKPGQDGFHGGLLPGKPRIKTGPARMPVIAFAEVGGDEAGTGRFSWWSVAGKPRFKTGPARMPVIAFAEVGGDEAGTGRFSRWPVARQATNQNRPDTGTRYLRMQSLASGWEGRKAVPPGSTRHWDFLRAPDPKV